MPKDNPLLRKISNTAIALWIGTFFVDRFFLEGSLNEVLGIALLSVIFPVFVIQAFRGKIEPGGDAG